MAEFSTGAVRSNDANDTDFYLIHPVALRELAIFCNRKICKDYEGYTHFDYINDALDTIHAFLDIGERRSDHLVEALWNIMTAIDRLNNFVIANSVSRYINYVNIPPYGLHAIAAAYAEGAKKYAPYNCEKGFPLHDLLNHALKHINDFLRGDMSEDQLGHAAWNLLMSVVSFNLWPKLNKNTLRPIK